MGRGGQAGASHQDSDEAGRVLQETMAH
jgi:hypothetical protein